MGSRSSEKAVKPLHHGSSALFRQGLHDTFEGGKRLRSWRIFRALRHLACDHGWAQDALGTIVGRLNARVLQKPQQIPTVMVLADAIEQALIVWIRQDTGTQVMGDGVSRGCAALAKSATSPA